MEPYALAVLAGAIPQGIDIRFYDDRLDKIDYKEQTDLVAISVETFNAKRSYAIAKKYREQGTKVIMGGFHPSLIPEETLEHADSVIIGEAEPVMEELICDFQNQRLKPIYHPGFYCDLSKYKANRRIFHNKDYIPMTLTHFSRGCPHACSFCPDAVLYKKSIRFRPVRDVVQEIEDQNNRLIFFVDNNITHNKERLKELLKAITPLKINWISQADLQVATDTGLLQMMSKSGCIGLVIGFESLSSKNLIQMNKTTNMPLRQRYDELVERIHDHGISMWAAFLLGYDYDTKDTIKETLDFAMKHRFFFAAFNQLIPYYGTPIYQTLQRERRLLFPKWWTDPDYKFGQVVYKPKNMTHLELAEECLKARLTFNKYANIFKRATNFNANIRNLSKLALFFKYTYLFKKEIRNKQDMILN